MIQYCIVIKFLIVLFFYCEIILSTSINQDKSLDEPGRQFHCCARYEKKIAVGHGVSGEIITIDAGHCRKSCPRHATDDPGDPSRPAVQRCSVQSLCHPRTSRLERVSTLQGVKIIETVDTCDCWPSQSKCTRSSFEQLVHSGTPYQVTMDVGYCHGTCSKSLSCRPLKNSTISIKGPDGDEIYQVINKCGCASKCHRMNRTESVLDYSQLEIKKGTSDVKPVVRHIDVGQCIGSAGSCVGNKTETTCLLRDNKDPSRCLAGLYSKQHNCIPAKFEIHEYRTRRGLKREIFQIIECACV